MKQIQKGRTKNLKFLELKIAIDKGFKSGTSNMNISDIVKKSR